MTSTTLTKFYFLVIWVPCFAIMLTFLVFLFIFVYLVDYLKGFMDRQKNPSNPFKRGKLVAYYYREDSGKLTDLIGVKRIGTKS